MENDLPETNGGLFNMGEYGIFMHIKLFQCGTAFF